MKIKETLNLGKTEFPMRGNLPVREAEWEQSWDENHVYEERLKLNEGKPHFVLHDGPPFANGNIHMGHALNKISKDIIVRYKSMSGYYAPYVPGWDTHGLPIEQQLAKKGVKRKEISLAEYREMCRDFAMNEVEKQKKDFKRLGVSGDWEHPYITLQPEYEAEEIRVFGEMYQKGYIYKGKKPVYWSPSSESTLAEAEIEYKDVKSASIYVAFKVVDGKGLLDPADTYFVIWTTTPWTIPSNRGISVNPDFEYSVVQVEDRKYVIATERLHVVAETLGWEHYETVKRLKGTDLEYMTAKHPFYDRTSLVMNGYHVTLDDGTGLVHTSPGHGADDFIVGQKYDLPIDVEIDETGHFNEDAPGFTGLFYDDANKVVTKRLEEVGALLKLSFFTHSYPHDWRTKKPVIFRATTQWFASIDPFRQQILDQIDQVKFLPDWGKTRLYNMIRDRGDWVISRQRAWGVPLPIFYAEDGTPIITEETIAHVANIFEKEGSNAWFKHSAQELLPAGFTHPGSPNGEFTKEKDIMDVWFDSGSSHTSVLKQRGLSFPADVYLEGSDQYRGWFNSSIITSVAVNGVAPYKQLISQGFVLDDKGHKMSKSLGNIIAPNDVIKQMGAEIIRLWVASVDASSDVAVSMDILRQVSESYRKIRNTMRFMLANTTDFEPTKNKVSFENLRSVDKYAEVKLNQVVAAALKSYEEYNFNDVYKKITDFLTNDLSAFYLDFAKDVLYIEAKDSFERRAMQTVMYDILVKLTKLLTPILPHTTEEIWGFLKEPEKMVQLAEMPVAEHLQDTAPLVEKWATFMDFRDDVLKSLEVARNEKIIGKSFEAKLTVYPKPVVRDLLESLDANFQQILIVSQFEIASTEPAGGHEYANETILVEHAAGEVCQRCRMTTTDVGSNPQLPTLCARCARIVTENFPEEVEKGFEG